MLQLLHNSGRQVTAMQPLKNQSLVRRKGKPVLTACAAGPGVVLLAMTFSANKALTLTLVATLDRPAVHHSPLRVTFYKLRRRG